MSMNYYVPTGTILKEYLEANNITQKALAEKLGCSEKYVSNLINGEAKMTEKVAIALEKIFTDVQAKFWLDIESNYRLSLAREEENNEKELENVGEIAKKYKFKEVFKGLKWPLEKQYDEMLKILKIKSFREVDERWAKLNPSFMQDGGDNEPILVWLSLCEEQIEIKDNDIGQNKFDVNELAKRIPDFKRIVYTENFEQAIQNLRIMCKRLGIYFVCEEAISGSKVRGATTTYNGIPAIYISKRLRYLDVIWFAFFHELGHLINDYNQEETMISFVDENEETLNEKEKRANKFARENLINIDDYNNFVDKNIFNENSILKFAKDQKVIVGIIIAFLQHDDKLDWNQFVGLKAKV